jgi:hypothetical protein
MGEDDGSGRATRPPALAPSEEARESEPLLSSPRPSGPSSPRPSIGTLALLICGAVLLLLLGGLLGAVLIRPERVVGLLVRPPSATSVVAAVTASPSPKPAAVPPPPSTISQPSEATGVLRADDFSDPARGLFPNDQRGVGRVIAEGGTQFEYRWSFTYRDGALVGRLTGAPPEGVRSPFGRALMAVDKLFDDFAVEVRGTIASSSEQTRFGVRYLPTASLSISFMLLPGATRYVVTHGLNQQLQTLSSGRSLALQPPDQDNLLRVEIRGDTARMFVNGQETARVQHEALARRGGLIGLIVVTVPPLENKAAEVRFRDFTELSLAP